ncbi:DUF2809 domain-containing protein [Streptomyces sp. DSS69]|uniref:ribosomal maturation YjgA family protein n=1 Tax=Streptomyces sp. DSS69 TaxID=3113369 RepID=UPI0031FA2797
MRGLPSGPDSPGPASRVPGSTAPGLTTPEPGPASPEPRSALRARALAAGAAVVTVAAGLGVRAGADGGALAKYAGSALYTVLLCALVAFCAPRARPVAVAGTALALSWAVELLQLTGVPAELSARGTAARLVLGSTFNAPDLFWYAVGAAAAWGVHVGARRLATPSSSAGPRPAASR